MTKSSQTYPITPEEALRLLEDSLSYYTPPNRKPAPLQPDLPGADIYYQAA